MSACNVCPCKVEKFWQHADWLQSQVSASQTPLFLNLDETAVQYAYYSAKGWIAKCVPPARANVASTHRRGAITHIAMISSVLGVQPHLPQILVVNTRRLSARLLSRLQQTAPSNVTILRRVSSWNTTDIMIYVLELLSAVLRARFPQYQAILVLDGAPMHFTAAVVRRARLERIWLLPVGPYLTRYIQPLDVAVFSRYKHFLEVRNRDVRMRQGFVDTADWFETIFATCHEFLCNHNWHRAFTQVGLLCSSEQSLNCDLARWFPAGRTSRVGVRQLTEHEFRLLLPKRCNVTFADFVGSPQGVPPLLA